MVSAVVLVWRLAGALAAKIFFSWPCVELGPEADGRAALGLPENASSRDFYRGRTIRKNVSGSRAGEVQLSPWSDAQIAASRHPTRRKSISFPLSFFPSLASNLV